MKNEIARESNPRGSIPVLSVAVEEQSHSQLGRVLDGASKLPPAGDRKFTMRWTATTTTSALALLKRRVFPVVICDCDVEPGSWKELLQGLRELDQQPSLIVTSRLADDYLWAEALNLGAFDVLAQPFDPEEVARVVHSAWRHWDDRGKVPRKRAAGGR